MPTDTIVTEAIWAAKDRCASCQWYAIAQEIDPSEERCGYRGKFWWQTDLPYLIREYRKGGTMLVERCPFWEGDNEDLEV